MKINDIIKTKKKYDDIVYDLIEAEIIKEVKKIFKSHTNLIEFTDVMGSCYFTDKNGHTIGLISNKMNKSTWNYVYFPTFKYFNRLIELYEIINNFCIGMEIKNEFI